MLDSRTIETTFLGVTDYDEVRLLQEDLVSKVVLGISPETIIICEHFPVLTFGKSLLLDRDLCMGLGVAGVQTDRGGLIAYHGPGQLVVYPVIDLRARRLGVKKFISYGLEALAEASRNCFGYGSRFDCYVRLDPVGLWVRTPTGEKKVGFAGLRVQDGVTNHGFALNVNCDTAVFKRFVPCGLQDVKISSLVEISQRDDVGLRQLAHQVEDIFQRKIINS